MRPSKRLRSKCSRCCSQGRWRRATARECSSVPANLAARRSRAVCWKCAVKKGQVNKPGEVPDVLKSADERSPVATGLRREEEKQREVRALEAAVAAARAAACAELACAAVSSLHEELSAAKYRKFVAKNPEEQLTATRAYFQVAENTGRPNKAK